MEKKVTIGPKQLLLLPDGEIIEAKDSKSGMFIVSYSQGYGQEEIISVTEHTGPLAEFMSGQGRRIQCANTTSFVQWISESIDNYVAVARYIPIFGEKRLDEIELDCLISSLLYNQNKRPNQYILQTIPLYLSKLCKESLLQVADRLHSYKTIKHLSRQSKNILMMLFERLGIPFDGKSYHTASYPSGTIKFLVKNRNRTNYLKRESLIQVSDYMGKNITLEFSKKCDTILIGSFLCQIH